MVVLFTKSSKHLVEIRPLRKKSVCFGAINEYEVATRNGLDPLADLPPSSVITTTMVSGPFPSGLKTLSETKYWV